MLKLSSPPWNMADVFSLVMGVVCIFSAIFIIVLVASFAWVCVRALAFDDNLLDLHDSESKQLREPLVEHIYAQDVKNSDIEVSTCVWISLSKPTLLVMKKQTNQELWNKRSHFDLLFKYIWNFAPKKGSNGNVGNEIFQHCAMFSKPSPPALHTHFSWDLSTSWEFTVLYDYKISIRQKRSALSFSTTQFPYGAYLHTALLLVLSRSSFHALSIRREKLQVDHVKSRKL